MSLWYQTAYQVPVACNSTWMCFRYVLLSNNGFLCCLKPYSQLRCGMLTFGMTALLSIQDLLLHAIWHDTKDVQAASFPHFTDVIFTYNGLGRFSGHTLHNLAPTCNQHGTVPSVFRSPIHCSLLKCLHTPFPECQVLLVKVSTHIA